jgi:hypothetical protein
MKPKNGDMYMKDDNQVIIFYGDVPGHDADANRGITAIFGEGYSGKLGIAEQLTSYHNEIVEGDTRYTYIGNISDIFRGILDDKPKAR